MEFRATYLEATNVLSVRPVVLLRQILDLAPDASDRMSKLSESLSPECVLKTQPAADGNEKPSETLCYLAVNLLEAVGIPDMKVVSDQSQDDDGAVGFECLFIEAGQQVLRALKRLLELEPFDAKLQSTLKNTLQRLRSFWTPRVSHFAAQSALRLNIPWRPLTETNRPLIVLGHGIHRRLFWRNMTPETSEIAVTFTTPKNISSMVLHSVGVPVPQQFRVQDIDTAVRAARRIGWPVVAKPINTDFGTGITTQISNDATLAKAYTEAKKHGNVLIEKHIDGTNHRLLVHKGNCISATRQDAAHVIGDGVHNIAELVAQTNITRTDEISANWKKITINDGLVLTLERQGLTLQSTPVEGRHILLRSNSNVSQGGTFKNVTQDVHPENRNFAAMAAAAFGLDLAGVDMMTTDITKPLHETGGAVIEVNATPGLVMGETDGLIEDQIITHHFPAQNQGSIPIIACVENIPSASQQIAETFNQTEQKTAFASPNEIKVGSNRIASDREVPLPRRTAIVLANHRSEMAVLSVRPEELISHGLGVDRLAVAVGSSGIFPSAIEALIALDRVSENTVLSQNDLKYFLEKRVGFGPVWCIMEGVEQPNVDDISTIRQSSGSTLIVKPANENAFEASFPLGSDDFFNSAVLLAVVYALKIEGRENYASVS